MPLTVQQLDRRARYSLYQHFVHVGVVLVEADGLVQEIGFFTGGAGGEVKLNGGELLTGKGNDMLHKLPADVPPAGGRAHHNIFYAAFDAKRMAGDAKAGTAQDVPVFNGGKKVGGWTLRSGAQHLRRYGDCIVKHFHKSQKFSGLGIANTIQLYNFHTAKVQQILFIRSYITNFENAAHLEFGRGMCKLADYNKSPIWQKLH